MKISSFFYLFFTLLAPSYFAFSISIDHLKPRNEIEVEFLKQLNTIDLIIQENKNVSSSQFKNIYSRNKKKLVSFIDINDYITTILGDNINQFTPSLLSKFENAYFTYILLLLHGVKYPADNIENIQWLGDTKSLSIYLSLSIKKSTIKRELSFIFNKDHSLENVFFNKRDILSSQKAEFKNLLLNSDPEKFVNSFSKRIYEQLKEI